MHENDRPKQHPRGRLGICASGDRRTFPSRLLGDPAQRKPSSCLHFLFNALRFFRGLGVRVERVMTDNGSGFRSRRYAQAVRRLKIKHLRTKPYTPKPTARPIDSSRQACASGPTPGPTAPPKNAPPNCPSGSPATTAIALMAVLTQSLRSRDSPYGSTASQRFVWSAAAAPAQIASAWTLPEDDSSVPDWPRRSA
jgi:hypothetical protein